MYCTSNRFLEYFTSQSFIMLRSLKPNLFRICLHLRTVKHPDDVYEKLTPREHVLARPDMYIGNTSCSKELCWVYDETGNTMERKELKYSPGLYKIFDEIIVNAADNKTREGAKQTYVKVEIDRQTGAISVENDGIGIPVVKHRKYKLWIPEMIFGHVLTSSNYDESKKRITGGRYGYGAKLTNIFSKEFSVDTNYEPTKQFFSMKWQDHMMVASAPEVREGGDSGYTKISFLPDYARFEMDNLTDDMYELMCRRVVDLAGVIGSNTTIYLNATQIKVHNFKEYCALYPGARTHPSVAQSSYRWDVLVCTSDEGYNQTSFVNCINTTRGGTHVNYVMDALSTAVISHVQEKIPQVVQTKDLVRQNISLFLNCKIENPHFDSQTKTTLRSRTQKCGSLPELENLISRFLAETDIVDRVLVATENRYSRIMKKHQTTVVSRTSTLLIPKLEDAVHAGTIKSNECTLIITEGDSAKAFAVAGLSVLGRDYHGIYPIRGVLMNVRSASVSSIARCTEVRNLLAILGLYLKTTKGLSNRLVVQQNSNGLRYGKLLIMADQDLGGDHIKGLIANLIQVVAPQLFQRPGFLAQFVTPLVKAFGPRGEVRSFYSMGSYTKFTQELEEMNPKPLYRYKYYKGLGTNTSAEAKEYFRKMDAHTISFVYDPVTDENVLALPFGKSHTQAAERRTWIKEGLKIVTQDNKMDFSVRSMSYHQFVHRQMIRYSIEDCARSIPHLMDGLKITQRKILFAALKRNLRDPIKVVQFCGYIAEHTAYHHGDVSLQSTAIAMAQNFVGSNNVPLLLGEGQFGTRLEGGVDVADPQDLHIRLSAITHLLFRAEDEPNLTHEVDEALTVQPQFYVPVIPTLLVNGSHGIGTGFSTSIPGHDPLVLIELIRSWLKSGKEMTGDLKPWVTGFKGKVHCLGKSGRYYTTGRVSLINGCTVRVTELPAWMWTSDYKVRLDGMVEKGVIRSYQEHHTVDAVDFEIELAPQVISMGIRFNVLYHLLSLVGRSRKSRFIVQEKPRRIYQLGNAMEVLKNFCEMRMHFYELRKKSEVQKAENQLSVAEGRHVFLRSILDGKINISGNGADIVKALMELKIPRDPVDGSYEYLLGMTVVSLCSERRSALAENVAILRERVNVMRQSLPKDFWLSDLEELEVALRLHMEECAERTKIPAQHPKLRPNGTRISLDMQEFANVKSLATAKFRAFIPWNGRLGKALDL